MTKITIELLEKHDLLDSVVIKKIEDNTINFTDEIKSDIYNKIVDTKRIKRLFSTNKISSYLRRIDFKYKNQGDEILKRYTYINDNKLFNKYSGEINIKALNVGSTIGIQTYIILNKRDYDVFKMLFYVVDIDDDSVYLVPFIGEREAKKFLTELKRISNKELKEQEKLNKKQTINQ